MVNARRDGYQDVRRIQLMLRGEVPSEKLERLVAFIISEFDH